MLDLGLLYEELNNHIYIIYIYIGDRYYSSNVHLLLHFADSVRCLGPLWAHSVFPFEDANGWLGDLYHGTRDPQKQVRQLPCD